MQFWVIIIMFKDERKPGHKHKFEDGGKAAINKGFLLARDWWLGLSVTLTDNQLRSKLHHQQLSFFRQSNPHISPQQISCILQIGIAGKLVRRQKRAKLIWFLRLWLFKRLSLKKDFLLAKLLIISSTLFTVTNLNFFRFAVFGIAQYHIFFHTFCSWW